MDFFFDFFWIFSDFFGFFLDFFGFFWIFLDFFGFFWIFLDFLGLSEKTRPLYIAGAIYIYSGGVPLYIAEVQWSVVYNGDQIEVPYNVESCSGVVTWGGVGRLGL